MTLSSAHIQELLRLPSRLKPTYAPLSYTGHLVGRPVLASETVQDNAVLLLSGILAVLPCKYRVQSFQNCVGLRFVIIVPLEINDGPNVSLEQSGQCVQMVLMGHTGDVQAPTYFWIFVSKASKPSSSGTPKILSTFAIMS